MANLPLKSNEELYLYLIELSNELDAKGHGEVARDVAGAALGIVGSPTEFLGEIGTPTEVVTRQLQRFADGRST